MTRRPLHALAILMVAAGGETACNALWGVDELTYGPSQPATSPGGGGAGGTGGSAGMGGAGAEGAADAGADVPQDSAPVTLVFGEGDTADVSGVTADTMLFSEEPTNNYGASPTLHADTDPPHVTLLRFDLSIIPPGAEVLEAQLSIWTRTCPYCELISGTVQAYPLSESWAEGQVDNVPGVANWTERSDNAAWTTPGAGAGSIDDALVAEFMPGEQGTEYLVDVELELVIRWVENPQANYGLLLLTTSPSGDGVGFESSESTLSAQRPSLRVTYRP